MNNNQNDKFNNIGANLKIPLNSKILIATVLYIIAIPISNLSQISYWVVIALSPFLFYKNSAYKIKGNKRKYLIFIFITFILVLFTGLISFDIAWPMKRSIMLFSIWLVSYFLFKSIDTINGLFAVLKGLVFSSILYSLLLFNEAYTAGFSFTFNENSYLGKNSSAPFILIGLFASILSFNLIGKKKKYLLISFYFFIIILMTTAIKVIIPSILIFLVSFLLGYKSIKARILFSFFSLLLVFSFSYFLYTHTNIQDSDEFKITTSRIIALFGGTPELAYTVNVTVKRENLIQSGWEIFLDNKLFGIGLENTRHIIGTYTHNTIIELLAGGGIFTAFFFLLAFYYPFKEILTVKDFNIRLLLLFMFISVLIIGQAQRLYDNQIMMFFIALTTIIPKKLNQS